MSVRFFKLPVHIPHRNHRIGNLGGSFPPIAESIPNHHLLHLTIICHTLSHATVFTSPLFLLDDTYALTFLRGGIEGVLLRLSEEGSSPFFSHHLPEGGEKGVKGFGSSQTHRPSLT